MQRNGTTTRTAPELTVWYDADCPLCVREIALMRRLDRAGAIEFVDARRTQHCPVDPQELLSRFHAREADGTLFHGAAAFAAMWRRIPLLKPLGHAARLAPVSWLLEVLYRLFLRVRPHLQRLAVRLEHVSTDPGETDHGRR